MDIIHRRMTAKIDGDFAVFLIGARLNKLWKFPKMKWMGDAFNAMVKELAAAPESGFLHAEAWFGRTSINVQYWRSVEQLMAYARDRESVHFPAWVRFNKEAKSGDFGIWHETYIVRAGDYECIYNQMPSFGLARAAQAVEATGHLVSGRGRLGLTDGADAPVLPDGTEARMPGGGDIPLSARRNE